jgi:hypothetical protein
MKITKILLHTSSLFLLLIVTACSSSSDNDDDNPPPPTGGPEPEVLVPAAATLVFPENNTECNTGVVDSTDDTKSSVTFMWNASQNTDRYSLTITDLNTNLNSNTNVDTNEATVTIDRGTPYSWSVTSRANGTTETATSAVFRFYNEGPGVENYAPFPAEAINPARGVNLPATTTVVTLEWSASDIDDDITGYEIFFGNEANTTTSLGSVTETSIADISVTTGTYYWKVITSDSQGNTSTSEVFQFKVL